MMVGVDFFCLRNLDTLDDIFLNNLLFLGYLYIIFHHLYDTMFEGKIHMLDQSRSELFIQIKSKPNDVYFNITQW